MIVKKRPFLTVVFTIIIIIVSVGYAKAQNTSNEEAKPNIIFLMADDWGWGDLGYYGNRRIQTPNIDQLAEEGIRFTQFYQGAAVCSPSRASIMTGLFTKRHGIRYHMNTVEGSKRRDMPTYLDPKLPMLPKILNKAGYATAHYGKWHLTATDDIDAPRPEAYGFDDHRLTVGHGSAIHLEGLSRSEYHPEDYEGWHNWDDAFPWSPHWEAWRAEASKRIVDESIQFIKKHKDQPFYIQAWFYDTHGRLTPTRSQMEPFKDLPEPYRIYYAAVLDTDRQIGRLMEVLDNLNLSDNTIVIFTSDNGPENLELYEVTRHGVGDPGPFRGRKRSGYEGGIRLPLIVRWPNGSPSGQVDSQTVISAVDMLPTLARLAGAEVPEWPEIDGLNMAKAIQGHPMERKRPIYWHLGENVVSVGPEIDKSPKLIIRDGPWKLLMHPDGSGIELYNIEANSLEVDNLADTHPKVVKRLSGRLQKWNNAPNKTY